MALSSRFSQKKKPKNRIGYLLSFPANDHGFLTQLHAEFPQTDMQIFYTQACEMEARQYEAAGFKIKSLASPIGLFLTVIPWLTQAKVIICDNYFAFLSDLSLTKEQQVFQIWHANGAIKTFGWQDEKTSQRSQADQRRFQKVYDQFDQIVVGSDAMAKIFKDSYHLSDKHILRTGLPRTDYYWDQTARDLALAKVVERLPNVVSKKTVLYVPTYRDRGQVDFLDLTELAELLGEDYLVVCKAHPQTLASHEEGTLANTDFKELKLNEILASVDYLVTDYSSIPFEYSLANQAGKLIFYCPDLSEYQQTTGIQPSFSELLERESVRTTIEVAELIKENLALPVSTINETWNEYNDGQATTRLLAVLAKHLR